MNLPFTKLQGLGNDFVVVEAAQLQQAAGRHVIEQWQRLAPAWARTLCDRNFGVGADGLIVLFDLSSKTCKPPEFVQNYPGLSEAQYAWTYTNSDGSWSATCGNGLRCAALFLKDVHDEPLPAFLIATASGPLGVKFTASETIETDFGAPVLDGQGIPASWKSDKCVRETIDLACFDSPYKLAVTAVGMGNPHCVIFDDIRGDDNLQLSHNDREDLARAARAIQQSQFFPESVNVEFARVQNREKVSVVIYERGCGWTLACGTGAAATLVAGVLENKLERNCEIELPGGSAHVSWSEVDNHVRLSGPAAVVFRGTFDAHSIAQGALVSNIREVVA